MSIVKAPSPALVIACVALFVALGGTAIAAAPIAKRALFANPHLAEPASYRPRRRLSP